MSEELEKINEAVKNRMELLESRRQIIKFEEEEKAEEKAEESYSGIRLALQANLFGIKKYKVKNKHRDGDIVNAKKIIADIGVYVAIGPIDNPYCQRTISIKTSAAGKIYYLRKDDEVINIGDDIAILADVGDTREQVMEWYNQIRK